MTSVSNAMVEARGLRAPGYMGLPQARHIYLVATDHKFDWPCFGRGYAEADPGEKVITASIYKELAFELAKPNSGDQYLAGVANTVNGTCHTLANRILALSDNENANVSNSIDDPYSVVVFGKYGYGTTQFCDLLTQAFNKAGQNYNIPNSLLDNVLERAKNPFKDELKAWEIVIGDQMKINVTELLNSSPGLRNEALAVITSYCKDRDSMYEQCFDYKQGRPPNAEEAAKIKTMLKDLALKYVENVLNALTISHHISLQQKDAFKNGIMAYIDSMGR